MCLFVRAPYLSEALSFSFPSRFEIKKGTKKKKTGVSFFLKPNSSEISPGTPALFLFSFFFFFSFFVKKGKKKKEKRKRAGVPGDSNK